MGRLSRPIFLVTKHKARYVFVVWLIFSATFPSPTLYISLKMLHCSSLTPSPSLSCLTAIESAENTRPVCSDRNDCYSLSSRPFEVSSVRNPGFTPFTPRAANEAMTTRARIRWSMIRVKTRRIESFLTDSHSFLAPRPTGVCKTKRSKHEKDYTCSSFNRHFTPISSSSADSAVGSMRVLVREGSDITFRKRDRHLVSRE